MKVSFVVLHYKVADITEECVNLILKQNYKNLNIIIVDNNSNNGSLEYLKSKYHNEKNIYIIGIEENIGFAKANDLGYQIAKHKFNAEMIVVINNDLMIYDNMFCQNIVTKYKECNFDILGPDIINKEGVHQNPLKNCITNRKQLNKRIFKYKI
ncbi:MAG: glycosyltransferase, partial [Clostridia bacterium]|nr:glycosyltransferase [Clostridia bacterium]